MEMNEAADIQSAAMAMAFMRSPGIVTHPGPGFVFMTMITLTSGTAFIMWLGEQITERGIGNGMSLIIFAGIVVRLPSAIIEVYQKVSSGEWNPLFALVVIAVLLTHSFIGSGNTRWNVAPDEYPGIEGNDGSDMWNELVQPTRGQVVATGTPEQIASAEGSHTGRYLKQVL